MRKLFCQFLNGLNTREETHGLKTDSYDYYVRPTDEFWQIW